MEDNNNNKKPIKPLSNSYKFSSSLLNRPFSSNDNKEQIIDEEIPEQDIPEHNMTNYNNNKGIPVDFSTSSIVKNNDSMNSSKTSLNATISFNKRDLISQFNNKDNIINNNDNTTTVNNVTNNNISDMSNNIISSSTSNIKKRKPFDKLSFHSEAQTNQNSNNLIEKNNTSIISNSDNGNNNNNTSGILNKSNISDMEKSMILSSYKLLSKSTLEKAKLFNNQYKNSTPFWIKFFEEIENDSLKSNSSYYKVNNKSEYVKSLIEMVQRDADIYDSMNKNNATKKETQKSIKQILNESTNQVDKSAVSNSKKEKEDKNNIEIDNKLNQVLNVYDKLDEKNKKIYNNEGDYDTFKFNLITGGKFNSEKKSSDVPLEEKMKRIDEEEEKKNKEQKKNEIKEYKTIDKLYFGDDYTFEDLNYDKIDFSAYKSETIKKLLELDKRLHKIDPVRYNTSINTELKKIQDEFNEGKRDRMEKVEKETRELFKKYLEDSKETKRTIFDIKEKDQTKIKYRDYLKEFADQKKHKKQIEDSLIHLDKIIQQNNKKEISPVQREKLKKELEAFHNTKEYQDKFDNFKVPGVIQLQQVTNDISSFEERNKQLMNELNTMKEQIEIENKKTCEETKKEEEKYNNEVVIPFLKYQEELEAFDKDNKIMIDKVNKLEEENNKEEEKINETQMKINILLKQKEDYEKFFEEGDKLFKEEVKENNTDKDDIDLITKDELYKKYGLDDILKEDSEDKEIEEKLKKEKEEFEKIKKEMDDEYNKLQQTGIKLIT